MLQELCHGCYVLVIDSNDFQWIICSAFMMSTVILLVPYKRAEVEVGAGRGCVFISVIVEMLDQYLYTMGL